MLIHGAYGTIDLWGSILETLAQYRQAIAIEPQGHGHTADSDRPFSYEQFADDVAALMQHLGIAQTDVVGYSIGGNTGLQLAIRHPDLVRKLVAISANYLPRSELKVLDVQVSAGTADDIRSIEAPTLLIIGDSDTVRPEHAVELFRLLDGGVPGDLTDLPKSQLAILPGSTHVTIVFERTDVLLAMIEAFLDPSMPETP